LKQPTQLSGYEKGETMCFNYLRFLSAVAGGFGVIACCVGALAQTPSTTPAQKKPVAVPSFGAGITTAATSGPDMTSETYGDWIIRCQPAADAKRCEASQTIMIQGQNSPIALIAFGREKKGDPLRMVIQLPTNITFESGVKTHLAGGEAAVDMKFRRCFPVGCFADAAMTDAVLSKLKAQGEPLSIKFKDGTEREISLPFSPRGLGPALDALSKL
jgi:invasion protein IalB